MFCINCGYKLEDGMRFCPNCGANVVTILGNKENGIEYCKSEEVSVVPDKLANDVGIYCKEEQQIEKIFSEIFKRTGMFGKRIYIIGKDTVPGELKESIEEYFLSSNSSEKPLLAFDYSDKKIAEGFVITNQRLVWNYGISGWSEIPLKEIKSVTIGKAILASVMNISSYDNEKYPQIYLTGIDEEQEFVIKFRKFIDTIHTELYRNMGENSDNDGNQEYVDESIRQVNSDNTEFIVQSCNITKIDSIYCELGNPTISLSSSKSKKARLYFNIPDAEEIFFIYDATILGGCKKGFALCTSGFYYNQNAIGYIPWKNFRNIEVSKEFGGIRVGNESFNTSSDTRALLMILNSIQEYLK